MNSVWVVLISDLNLNNEEIVNIRVSYRNGSTDAGAIENALVINDIIVFKNFITDPTTSDVGVCVKNKDLLWHSHYWLPTPLIV